MSCVSQMLLLKIHISVGSLWRKKKKQSKQHFQFFNNFIFIWFQKLVIDITSKSQKIISSSEEEKRMLKLIFRLFFSSFSMCSLSNLYCSILKWNILIDWHWSTLLKCIVAFQICVYFWQDGHIKETKLSKVS